MRTKTVKRLGILFAVLALVSGSAFAVWRFQVQRLARGVVRQADEAVKKGEYVRAVELYQQHLQVVPDDLEARLKYAEALLKMQRSPKNQESAMGIYYEILRQQPGRADVRRRAAELALEMPAGWAERARAHLAILLKSTPTDGELEFMMGRCYEEDKDPGNAAIYYRRALEHRSPKRLEASRQLALLIRGDEKLGTPADADRVIDEMVEAAPKDYRAYLERGRYRGKFNLEGAEEDLRKALELEPDHPEIYKEAAELAERGTVPEGARRILEEHRPFALPLPAAIDVARRILDDGLKAVPGSPLLYMARAELERKAGRVDRYIELLEAGVKEAPGEVVLHLQLALMLAARGDTGKLLLQVEELKGLAVSGAIIEYFTAYYYYNKKEYKKAEQVLALAQGAVAQSPDLKARVNVLLAQCYGQLREPEKQLEANQRAFDADQKNVRARLGWIAGYIDRLVGRGQIDEAIGEYRRQLEQAPELDRATLVNLMMLRNRQRPASQRDWREVEELLDGMDKAAPASAQSLVLRATAYAEQGRAAQAREILESARARYPEAVEPWTAEAELLTREGKFDEALGRLDLARERLGGDRAELRQARAATWASRRAPDAEVVKVLRGLAEGTEPFPRPKRRNLLAYLARELAARDDVEGAARLWSRLGDDDPTDRDAQVRLFEIALQSVAKARAEKRDESKAKADVEARIAAIGRVDETYARLSRIKYLTWQAAPTREEVDAARRAEGRDQGGEKKRMRAEARVLLAELKARRSEWDQVPLAEALLEEQELALAGRDEALRREKQESLITLYLAAIDLGSRNPAVIRQAVGQLITAGRSSEAIQLFNRMAATMPLGGELGQQLTRVAIDQNSQQAEETMRKAEASSRAAIAADPGNFQERLWLANILMAGKRAAEAEAELRSALAQSDADPDRWRVLVNFLVLTKQLPEAEKAIGEAEKKLTGAPLALAECCELVGRANGGPKAGAASKRWYDEARSWLEKALAARKDPEDRSIERRLVQFLLQTDAAEAEGRLKQLLGGGRDGKDVVTSAWARRTLAALYINGNPRRPAEALALFDAPELRGSDADPEDRRAWIQALLAQGTREHRLTAIAGLEVLVGEQLANEDQRLLARLYEAEDNWPKAREQYRSLIERVAQNASSPDNRRRQIPYRVEFADRLLQPRGESSEREEDLAEARQQIDELKRLAPNLMASVELEAALLAARNNMEGAATLIRSTSERGDFNPAVLPQLALLAEKRIGPSDEFKLADELFRKYATAPGAPFHPNKKLYLSFLARRERFADLLDLGEAFRKEPGDRATADLFCVSILGDPTIPARPEHVGRVVGWLEGEVRDGRAAPTYWLALGHLYERMGQERKAEESYRAAVKGEDRDGIASNNLAWLMALGGGPWKEALELIDRAIQTKGPIPDFLDTRGVVYLAAGDGPRAIRDLKAAVDAAPSASKLFHLAQAYLAVNDKPNARKNLEAARTKGLPIGLHRLEKDNYQKLLKDLGMP